MIPRNSYPGVWRLAPTNNWLSLRRFLSLGAIKHYNLNKAKLVQDISLAQASREAQSFLNRRTPLCASYDIRAYHSLDFNPGDSWLLGVFVEKSVSYAHAKVLDLSKSMKQSASRIYPQEVWRTCLFF